MEKERVQAIFAVKWQIDRGSNADNQRMVGLTFTTIEGQPVRVLLHWAEAEKFSTALAEDVRLNDPHAESRERYRTSDQEE